MSTQITDMMKKAALAGAVRAAIQSGYLKVAKQEPMRKKASAEQVNKIKTLLKSAGVNRNHVAAAMYRMKLAQMPKEEVFQKVAKATGIDVANVKGAYLQKVAIGWLPLAGGIGAGLMAPAVMKGIGNMIAPSNFMQRDYQPSPDQRAYERHIQGLAQQNLQSSRNLQLLSGAFRPAPNPWGQQQQPMYSPGMSH